MIAFKDSQGWHSRRYPWKTFREALQELYDRAEHETDRMENLVKEGNITASLGAYVSGLVMMDSSLEEAKLLAENGYFKKIPEALMQARLMKDSIHTLFFSDDTPKKSGFYEITTLKKISPYHQELVDFANQRYQLIVREGERLISGASA